MAEIFTTTHDTPSEASNLKIIIEHDTWDMSVHNTCSRSVFWEMRDMKAGASLDLGALDGGVITLISVTADAVTLSWGEEEYIVSMKSVVQTPTYPVANRYLTSDSVTLTFEYRLVSDAKTLVERIQRGVSDCEQKEEILHDVDFLIETGHYGLRVAKTLLSSVWSWDRFEINNYSEFSAKLSDDILHGSLTPDDEMGWYWISIAAENNDLSTILKDDRLFGEALQAAARRGVATAMNL